MNALVPLENADAHLAALLDKHDATLRPGIYGNDREVDRYTKLIPETEAQALMTALVAALRSAGFDDAKFCTGLLLGSFAARPLIDVNVFTGTMTKVFLDYPFDVGEAAVNSIARRIKFIPAVAEVEEACREIVNERRNALRIARAHLAENRHRREEAAEPKTERVTTEEIDVALKKGGMLPAGPKEHFQPPAEPRGLSPDQLESAGMDTAARRAFWAGRLGVGAEELPAAAEGAEEPTEGAEATTERAEYG